MAQPVLPSQARVVIIGGGIIGTSIAYHLGHLGWRDVVLLERDRLTSGTTWHAAGLMVTFGSTSETSTELRKYTRDLYARLEAETGQDTGFRPVGFIEVASDPGRLEEYRRVSAFNRHLGVDVHELSPGQVKELFPPVNLDGVLAGFYVKEDGRVNPVDVTMALAKGARAKGVTVLEEVPVVDVLHQRGRVTGVRTALGDLRCELVVNCAGMWARQLGAKHGVSLPLQAAEHYYLLTGPMAGISRDWPVLEDPGCHGYYREEGGGMMVGLFEPRAAAWKVEGIPEGFSFGEIQPDWDRMGPFLERALSRVPAAGEAGLKKLFCGPESFTPDLRPLFGEAPELKGYFVAAGLNSIGILTGGGLGRAMAHWLDTGHPDVDVTGMNVDRLQPFQGTPEYRRLRTTEALGLVYACHYPAKSFHTARDAKRSPLHPQLEAAGAYFRDVSGWEGADWFAGAGQRPEVTEYSWGRQPWWAHWEAEHRATREGVVLMDMSFMSKFLVQGRDAGARLEWLSANRVAAQDGLITYTQWLNQRGTLEADLTVTRLGDERYWVVATDTAHRHVETLLRRGLEGHQAFVTDVTGGYAQLNVQGPRSRELLQRVTSADLSNQAFPYRAARDIDLGLTRVLCVRITYLGELGYELYIPAEAAAGVYRRLLEAGSELGVRHAGLKALSSLRLEKGYRDYGHDLDNTDDPSEAGLGFAVDLEKPGGFVGKEAVLARKARGPLTRRLVSVVVKDPSALLFHAEVLWRDGKRVGYLRAGSYGFTVGGAVGLAMVEAGGGAPVDAAWLASGTWEVEVAGKRFPCACSLKAPYDPTGARIKA